MLVGTLPKVLLLPGVGGVAGKAMIWVKPVQLAKVVLPNDVTLLPIVKPVKLPHPTNALLPMVWTELGITSSPVNPEQAKKAPVLIVVSWLESVNVPLKPEQL